MSILKDPHKTAVTECDASACERMVALLDQQISELEECLANLRPRRARWAERLHAVRTGLPIAPTRAGHGALRDIVLLALREAPGGLTLEQLREQASRSVAAYNPKSLRQTLSRLRIGDVVEHRNGRWRMRAPTI